MDQKKGNFLLNKSKSVKIRNTFLRIAIFSEALNQGNWI